MGEGPMENDVVVGGAMEGCDGRLWLVFRVVKTLTRMQLKFNRWDIIIKNISYVSFD